MFEHLPYHPLDPIFQLLAEYQVDPRPEKVNLGIGLYADHEGKPFVFPVVKEVFGKIDLHNFNYQPIGGNKDFLRLAGELVLPGFDQKNLALHTTCGGTQACSLFKELLLAENPKSSILLGTPTWPNHLVIFKNLSIKKFDHLNAQGEANFEGYVQAIESAKSGDVLLLHGGLTHNPTGRNLSLEQLKKLIPILKRKKVFVFLDFAYLGFGEGIGEDRKYVQIFFDELDDVACGISFSKNASLYEHRIGVLIIKTNEKQAVESQLQQFTRESISMAPGLGQEVMTLVLRDHQKRWSQEVDDVRRDMDERKAMLLKELPDEFQSLKECRGMFGLLPLTSEQVQRLKNEYAVYVTENARINFAGILPGRVGYIASSIRQVL